MSKPTDIIIEVHAASINGHDVIMASGKTKMLQMLPMPYPIGLDFAGVVLDKGDAVGSFGKGDRVYGFYMGGGTVSTHLHIDTTKRHALCKIPDGLDLIHAASLPAVVMTADLGLKRADEFFKANQHGGLAGKTVFIPGALSGVGSVALQIAKRYWKCYTITAASASKIPQIDNLLGEDAVNEVYDYSQVDVTKEIQSKHKAGIDFVFDTTGLAGDYIPMLKKGGFCLSIARLPPGSALKNEDPEAPKQSRMACIGQNVMDGMDAAFRTWAKTRHGVTYVYQKTDPDTSDLEAVSELVRNGVVRAIVGKTANFDDVEEVKNGCMGIFKGKGAVGKFVVTMQK